MLQKYFPILGEVNSPLASLVALGFTAEAVKVAVNGISNEVLETMLWASVEETETHRKEVAVVASELEAARVVAAKQIRILRYRAAQSARKARAISKTSRQVKAARRPLAKPSLKGLSGLSIEACRAKAALTKTAVRSAVTAYNTAAQAVEVAIKGGDVRAIRSSVAALKAATRLLEVRHLEFRFAREMVSISLARHSA